MRGSGVCGVLAPHPAVSTGVLEEHLWENTNSFLRDVPPALTQTWDLGLGIVYARRDPLRFLQGKHHILMQLKRLCWWKGLSGHRDGRFCKGLQRFAHWSFNSFRATEKKTIVTGLYKQSFDNFLKNVLKLFFFPTLMYCPPKRSSPFKLSPHFCRVFHGFRMVFKCSRNVLAIYCVSVFWLLLCFLGPCLFFGLCLFLDKFSLLHFS